MQRLFALGLTCLLAAAAVADETHWRADPTEPGNWFLPENWTAGVPGDTDWAYVQNGGTAVIGIRPGDALAADADADPWRGATANFLNVGGEGGGAVSQVALHTDIRGRLYIGTASNVPALYTLSGGSLSAGRIQLGYEYEVGAFAQTGGAARTDRLTVGAWPCGWSVPSADLYLPPNRFTLTGGEFHAGNASIGTAAIGEAVQKGGLLAVDDLLEIGGARPWPPILDFPFPDDPILIIDLDPVDLRQGAAPSTLSTSVGAASNAVQTNVYICPDPPSEGRYDLVGGLVTAHRIHVGRTGTVRQWGGEVSARYLAIDEGGAWTLAGGRLHAADGITCDGVLDFAGAATGLKADHGIFNFGQGTLADTGGAYMALGRESLAIFPRGFNPYKEFGHFESAGIVHYAGRPLYIPRRRGVVGWGRIDDFTVVGGTLLAADALTDDGVYPPYPAAIDLTGGLAVRGGKVDLGHGSLRVHDRRSGIADGTLRAREMVVDGPEPWDIVPLDGYAAEEIRAGRKAYDRTLRPGPRARFTHWSGRVVLDDLAVTDGLYLLRRGTLEAKRADVGGTPFVYGTPTFVQRGGEASFGRFTLGGYLSWLITNASGDDVLLDTGSLGQDSFPDSGLVAVPLRHDSRADVSGGRFTAGTINLYGGIGPATFTQTGGRVEATDYLRITGGEAAYRMLGGGLTVGTLEVGSRYPTGTSDGLATLALMNPPADVRVTERMTLGHGSRLRARRGAAIHLTGTVDDTGAVPQTTFDILSTDDGALAGLNDLALVFEGGTDGWSTLEVGGIDYGFSNQGFVWNFALEELHVGDEVATALLRLVDLVDNQPDWTGREALYVDRLFITEGSWLDPAGLNIYYHEGHFPDVGGLYDGGEDGGDRGGDGPGGGLAMLPEPATLALLAAGLGVLVRRKRRT